MENLHLKIKAIRKAQGKTQEQVADALDMTKGNLSRMEKGDVAISSERLAALAAFFNMRVEEVVSYETLEERVTKEERQDTLSEKLRQKEDRIRRMQQSTESFLFGMLGVYMVAEGKDRQEGKPDVKPAAQRLWETHAIEHLLNGENTSKDFLMLPPFREYRKLQAQATLEMIREELGLSPDDPDPILPDSL